MTVRQVLPTFELKDVKGAAVAERDVEPFNDSEKIFVDLILNRDGEEAKMVASFNLEHLVWAARATIWRINHPEADEDGSFPPGPPRKINFNSLGLETPSFQYDILSQFKARLQGALRGLEEGAQQLSTITANDPVPGSGTGGLMAAFIDQF